jgi:hypothetical protein
MAASLQGLPSSRLSSDNQNDTFVDSLGRIQSHFSGYPSDTPATLIRALRFLAESDEDTHGAVRDMATLVNAGHTLEFVGGVRAIQQARAEIESWSHTIYEEGGGIDALITNQAQELIVAGASCVEWFPASNRKSVQDVAIIQAEYIRRKRDPVTNKWTHVQIQTVGGKDIDLDPLTFNYIPLRLSGAKPYGVPLIISAIEAIDRKQKLLKAEMRVINAMSMIALVTATLPPPPEPEALGFDGESDVRYTAWLGTWAKEAADLISQGADKGLYLAQAGTEIKLTSIAKSGEGMGELTISNNRRVWTALRTLPMMRGWMDSTTEALAKVVYPILEADAGSIQLVLSRMLSYGINLHLRLMGIAAVAYVHFDQPDSPFAITHAQMELARAQTDEILKRVFGEAWAIHAMRRHNVRADDPAQAPEWWKTDPQKADAPQPEPKIPKLPKSQAYAFMDRKTGRYIPVSSMEEAWAMRQSERRESVMNLAMQSLARGEKLEDAPKEDVIA